ncbi:MAG: TolC family protein [Chthoniobacterales bacterium]|nr:TolC family protein [Chthoniobacterales bacterium]
MRKFLSYTLALLLPFLAIEMASTLQAGPNNTAGMSRARRFTLDQAIEIALHQNPDILRARQEIERVKGLVIEVQSQALPHLDVLATGRQTDPNLTSFGSGTTVIPGGTGTTPTPTAAPTATVPPTDGTTLVSQSSADLSYNLRLQVSQVVFAGGAIRGQIRAADFTRDISYYQFRNAVDQVIATVRQQFYQVLLNRALIGVQEESIRLLESQLQDQQNRFEAGTVPRFNVLQAQVAVSNQRPELFTARNDFRIAQLQLAKTLGLDYDPLRGESAPLALIGELQYHPRRMSLGQAISFAHDRRAFLKQQRASILSQKEQINVALAGYLPTVRLNGGYEFQSSPFTENIRDVQTGYFVGATGTWPIFDGFETAGKVRQAKAVLQTAQIDYDDAVRQVELEVQQAYSNLQQGRELIQSQTENVGQAEEALRLASARLSAGAGTQLEVLNARVEVTRAQSTRLQSLFSYNSALAEFDRVTATDTVYHEAFQDPLPRKDKRATATVRAPESRQANPPH